MPGSLCREAFLLEMLCRSLLIPPSRIAPLVIYGFFFTAIAITIIIKIVLGLSSSPHYRYAVQKPLHLEYSNIRQRPFI